jgi:predicted TIM-barrel fold metal-dependent hydrolase
VSNDQTFRIDTHAHIITPGFDMIPERRHTPDPALLETFLRFHDENGISHGVLIQPSVYGTDNTCMCEAIEKSDGRLHGIAVVDPSFSDARLDELESRKVFGVRFSLFDMKADVLAEPDWQALIKRLAARDWIIEGLLKSPDTIPFLEAVAPSGARLVIDHFGAPDMELGVNDPHFKAVLKYAESGRVWAKLSGPYRSGGADAVKPLARAFIDNLGPERLFWGSDWPWTRFQGAGFTYKSTLDWLSVWEPDGKVRAQILGPTSAEFYGFV